MSVELSSIHEFGLEFEPVVLAAVLRNDRFYSRYGPVLDSSAFNDANNRYLLMVVSGHWKEYNCVPSGEVLVDLIRAGDYRDKAGVLELAGSLEPVEDEGYVRDRVIGWAKWKSVQSVLDDPGTKDAKDFAGAVMKAASLGDDLDADYTVLGEEEENEEEEEVHITTPWEWLNEELHGGPLNEDLAVVLTVINGGKTTALVNIAKACIRQGLQVVYFTFEDGEAKIKRRFKQCICGMTVDQLIENRHTVHRRVRRFLANTGGALTVKKIESRRTRVIDAVAFVDRIQHTTGRKVDVMITDYAERFAPTQRYSEPRHALREVFEDCKWAAGHLGCLHWTAKQTNKLRTGKEVVSIEHAGEGYGTMESPDLVIGLGQTMEDESVGRMTLFTAKVRDGEKHQTSSLIANFAIQQIRDPNSR